MANTLLRDKARLLRSQGESLNDITKKLKAPKSTVRFWCRDIVLSKKQQQRLFKRQQLGGVLAAEKIRQKRIRLTKQILNTGAAEIGGLSTRELLLIGTALYWAEGYRKGDGIFGFTNSDPKMIRLIINWLEKVCQVDKGKVQLRICINSAHKNRLKEIQRFWLATIGMPLSQFSRPTLINTVNKKVYLNPHIYFGTLRVKVRQSTNLRRKIMGWIEGIAQNHLRK